MIEIRGARFAVVPVGLLDRAARREVFRAKALYERTQRSEFLRAIVRVQIREITAEVLRALTDDELVRIVTACDRETLRQVQQTVTEASAVAEKRGDDQARRRMARARGDVAKVAASMEARHG